MDQQLILLQMECTQHSRTEESFIIFSFRTFKYSLLNSPSYIIFNIYLYSISKIQNFIAGLICTVFFIYPRFIHMLFFVVALDSCTCLFFFIVAHCFFIYFRFIHILFLSAIFEPTLDRCNIWHVLDNFLKHRFPPSNKAAIFWSSGFQPSNKANIIHLLML